jgi:hypothetical protein
MCCKCPLPVMASLFTVTLASVVLAGEYNIPDTMPVQVPYEHTYLYLRP